MPDWEAKIRERLAPLGLDPSREADIVEELAQHLDDCYERSLTEGAKPGEAYLAALAELDRGDLADLKPRNHRGAIIMAPPSAFSSRTARLSRLLIDLGQDLRFALRGLRKQPGFTLLAILALSLGIGSATVGFGVVENLFFDPYPYKGADRMVTFTIRDLKGPAGPGRSWFALNEFLDYQQGNRVFDDMVGSYHIPVVYSGRGGAETFLGAFVTPNTFDFFGVPPLLGRGITKDDGKPGAPPVFVMNYRVWRERFGSDPKILNTVFTLNDRPTTLVGIMPPRFQAFGCRIWIPITLDSGPTGGPGVLTPRPLWVLGRMKPGVNLASVAAEMNVLSKQVAKSYSKMYPAEFVVRVYTLNDFVLGDMKRMLYALVATVMMLLLIACGNVANLLLARATARDREIAVRASIGATPGRLVRQLMAESFVLAAAGLIAGCGLAYFGLKLVVATIPQGPFPAEAVIGLNPVVLSLSLGVAFLVTFLCGLAPALHAVRGELPSRLASGRGANVGLSHGRFRGAVVASQIALSLVLMTGAGLMVRTFLALRHVDLGFDPARIGFAEINAGKAIDHNLDRQKVFFQQLLERVQAIPGVTAAGETSSIPALLAGPYAPIDVPGITHSERWGAMLEFCSEDYFRTLGLQLQHGRTLTRADIDSAAQVAVINRTLAIKYFGKADPVGKRMQVVDFDKIPGQTQASPYFEIIGVVADFKNFEVRLPSEPEVFVPYTLSTAGFRNIVVRSSVKPESLDSEIRRAIWAVDSNVAVGASGSVENWLDRTSFSPPHFGTIFLGTFAAVGLALAGIGVFSVMAYTVSLQTHEVGIRMALGAQRGDVLRMVLWNGVRLIVAGVIVGVLSSYGLTRFLANQLWGISATDSWAFGAAVVVMLVAGTAACILPARKATQVDPLIAIRCE
ncbi:MAG TPA: ABC transporter permease [Candidatus Angelobacter sp.]